MLTELPHDGIESTIWSILRQTYLALILDGTGVGPSSMSEPEQNLVLDPHLARLEHDVKMLAQVVAHAATEALGRFQEHLHSAPGLDHEMVDEAVAYAVTRKGDDE
jgi:hypothetical protein